jgi:hypothetical protein
MTFPEDTTRLKIVLGFTFGFLLIFVQGVLAILIALGKVEFKSSYGLNFVLSNFGTLGGAFAGWAFGLGVHPPPPPKPKPDDTEEPPATTPPLA